VPQQRGVVDGDRRLVGHRGEELHRAWLHRLPRREEGVKYADSLAARHHGNAREGFPRQFAQVLAQRLPGGVVGDDGPPVRDEHRLRPLEGIQHAQRRTAPPAFLESVEEVGPVPEAGGAHDAQLASRGVQGQDLNGGERVGLQHLRRERVKDRGERLL
jgi:hypothetical protein